ncbi:Pentatricopeptide repeat [Dillenia turbinata]|uniref:Pentatricopeptide repeat n=1 Tax=Dillenia turbinata TaxID=194707 RepID=A0AAN8W4K2_9MAGN
MEAQAQAIMTVTLPVTVRMREKKNRPSGVCPCKHHSQNRHLLGKIIRQRKREGSISSKAIDESYASILGLLGRKQLPHSAEELIHEMKSLGYSPTSSTLSALLICYADNGCSAQAQSIWDHILNGSFSVDISVLSKLFDAYCRSGQFDQVVNLIHQMSSRGCIDLLPKAYSLAVSCFGKGGQLKLMEDTFQDMVSRGFKVDSATGNAVVIYYSRFGSLKEMEAAYGRLKGSRILIEEEAIRAMSMAYIKENRFYKLGEFIRDVGLPRKNLGNLLWNILLLSYAANFKMKSLQREFLRMVEAGFLPDLTTFNIRALAFSRMSLFWDLHLSLEHMLHEKVVPDLVTYGCVIDAYLERRLVKNLNFALNKMNVDDLPEISTDALVFEVMGKGDFHLSSEAFLEFKRKKKWTYRGLIVAYLKKQNRSNQILWNC